LYTIDSEDECQQAGFNQKVTQDILPKVDNSYQIIPDLNELKKIKRNDLKR